jgi:sulfate adenylyltransferase subunit 1 (EFTu-like GTPase family)
MPLSWYGGPTLIEHLEIVEVAASAADKPFRMHVQSVTRPNAGSHYYCGAIISGRARPKDRLALLPTGKTVEIARVLGPSGDLDQAVAGQAVTLNLTEEVEISGGDVLAAHDARPALAEQFSAHIVWMSEQPMLPGRSYLLQSRTALVPAQVTELKHKINVNTFEHIAAIRPRLRLWGCRFTKASYTAATMLSSSRIWSACFIHSSRRSPTSSAISPSPKLSCARRISIKFVSSEALTRRHADAEDHG